jgi:hypothetical protein
VAAPFENRLRLFIKERLLPSGTAASLMLARWSTRLSRLTVAGLMAVVLFDRPPRERAQDKNASPPIEILRTKPVPMDGRKPAPSPSAGH